jgi:hypothetical protein
MTPFCFEHVFRAPSVAAVFAAYFDPQHQADQDRRLAITERSVLELEDTGEELRRVSRVVPKRQLPLFVRPFVPGQLYYVERLVWRRAEDAIELEIRPSILQGRAVINAVYRLTQLSADEIQRRYAGSVSVDVALVSSKIERGIVSEFERSMPIAAACTQEWLDGQHAVVSARPGLNNGKPSGIIRS